MISVEAHEDNWSLGLAFLLRIMSVTAIEGSRDMRRTCCHRDIIGRQRDGHVFSCNGMPRYGLICCGSVVGAGALSVASPSPPASTLISHHSGMAGPRNLECSFLQVFRQRDPLCAKPNGQSLLSLRLGVCWFFRLNRYTHTNVE